MKSVLITGAGKNTGLGIAEKFAQKGWAIFLTDRSIENAEQASEMIRNKYGVPCFAIQYDIGDVKSAEKLPEFVQRKGYVLDSLILNAASQGLNTDPLTVDIEDWASVINANVVGNFNCARCFAKTMVEADNKGTIVFLGSITYRDCNVLRSSYNTSKGAILSMTKSLAVDLGKYGIRINCVMPGPIHTDRYDVLDEETRARRNELCPIGRVSTAEDIAGAVYFLASDDSGNATGTGLIIDGGMDSVNAGRF